MGVQAFVNHAGLHADRVAAGADDAAEILGKSTTIPGPTAPPATPEPPPRAWTGICFCWAYCKQAATSAAERGQTTARGLIS